MNSRFDYTVLDAINNAFRASKAAPLNLGGTASGGGGPIGGIVGYLDQGRLSYDSIEDATASTPLSGMSVRDNLNHIRYRLYDLETSLSPISVNDDGVPVASGVTVLNFQSGITAISTVSGVVDINVTVSGGSLPTLDQNRIVITNSGGSITTDAKIKWASGIMTLEGNDDLAYIKGVSNATSHGLAITAGDGSVDKPDAAYLDLSGGSTDQVTGGAGDVYIYAGNHLANGGAGSVYINGGASEGLDADCGNVDIGPGWAYTASGWRSGKVFARGFNFTTPAILYTNTKAAIESLTATPYNGVSTGAMAYATDNPTAPFGTYNGVSWDWQSLSSSGNGILQRVLTSNLTLNAGECLTLVDYINVGTYLLTCNGDAVVEV